VTLGPSHIYLGNVAFINYFGNGVAAKFFLIQSHSSFDDDSSILGWDNALLCEYFLMFQTIAVPSSLGSRTD